jgi:ankyrin repeat protein
MAAAGLVSVLSRKTKISALLMMGFWVSQRYAIFFCASWAAFSALQVAAGPLHDAVRAGNPNAMEAALLSTNLDETDFILGTPLHIALSEGDAEIADILINAGADIEAQSELNGMRAIHIAASLGESTLVELLLAAGASISERDATGKTALHVATSRGATEVVKLLLENGAKVDSREPHKGFTPLLISALHGEPEIVELLVAAGADVEATSASGTTALMLAASQELVANVGDLSLIRYFADLGVDLEKPDSSGATVLSQAVGRAPPYDKIAELLRSIGATK